MTHLYPRGTTVRAATGVRANAPVVVGTIRGSVAGPAGEEAILATDEGTVFVPVAAIRGRIASAPPAWERWCLWVVVLGSLAGTLWAFGHIAGIAATLHMGGGGG